nr:ribonuclease H-like domain-containing protein [Tanacetum cinerariifolium]
PKVVSAAKLPILNPNEFDLWRMRIEQLQKLVSQLEIHGVSLSQEDVNLKFHRSLPSKWKTHTLIWRNKTDLEDKSLDDLFNSLKIYESEKSVSPDIHSSSSGAQTRKQGDRTENKDKGKSHVVIIKGFRDLNAEFEEYNNNSSNGVNATSFLVSTVGQNSIDNTNDFSAAGPSNAAMPNLEDLSHDADDVGAEAD